MEINKDEIKNLYENVGEVWPKDDKWHLYSKETIQKYLNKQYWNPNEYILNAGSGGNDYNINSLMHHRDIAASKVMAYPDHSVGTIEILPFKNELFDKIICVGSVINYCDANSTIAEFSRTLKQGGILYLEFESSWGFEHRKKTYYKQAATVVKLKYFNQLWTQWIFAPNYIKNLLNNYGFKIIREYKFHILSALSYSNNEDENKASKYARFDALFRKTPMAKHANNIIIKCYKL